MPLDASIPLKSVSQASDPLEAAGKIYSLKAAKQQAEMGDMQLHDSMSLKQAAQDPNVQGPDGSINFEVLMSNAIKRGVSQNTLIMLSKASEEQKAKKLQMQQQREAIIGKLRDHTSKSAAALLPQIDELAKTVGLDAAIKQFEPQLKQLHQEVDPMYKSLGVAHPDLDLSQTDKIYQGMKTMAGMYKPMSQAETLKTEETKRHNLEVEKISRTKSEAGITGEGALTANALTDAVDQYIAGDKTAATGYARNARMKAQFQNRLSERLREQGKTGKDLAAAVAEFQGITAGERSLGTRTAQAGMAVAEAQRMVPLALDASEAATRTGVKSFNDIQQAIQKGTASPELRRFVAANNSLVNVYARAVSPTGTPTVHDKEHAREVLSVAFSKGDYRAAVEQLQKEMEAAQASPGDVRREFRETVSGRKSEGEVKKRKPLSEFGGG